MEDSLPSGWERVQLHEIAEVNPRHSLKLSNSLEVTFVPMPALSETTWSFDFTQVRSLGRVRKGYTHFAEGDVLVAKITPCMENGKGAVASDLKNGIGCGTTELHVIRPRGNIHPKYIYHFIHQESFRREAARNFTGTAGQLRVPVSFIKEAEIPLAPLAEQRRIVAKLEKLLAKVESSQKRLERIPTILKRFRQSVLAAACSGRLTEDWRTEHEIDFEESWRTIDFFDFIVLQRGYDLVLSTVNEGKYPVVTSAGIEKYHSAMKANGPGVVTGRSGSVGKVHYIEQDYWPHNTVLFVRDFKGNLPKYVYYFLLGFDIRNYSASTAVPTLNRNNLRGVEVLVPPIEEQQEIARRIEALFFLADKIEARYQNAMAQVEKLTQSILAKAFRGELVPQDPNDEPARVLLQRVRQEHQETDEAVPQGRRRSSARKGTPKGTDI